MASEPYTAFEEQGIHQLSSYLHDAQLYHVELNCQKQKMSIHDLYIKEDENREAHQSPLLETYSNFIIRQ